MPRALFISKNLIGDSLYIQPALSVWAKEHPGWEIDLLTLDDHISCLYEGMGIPNLRVVFDKVFREYDFEFEFQVNQAFTLGEQEKIHIATAYAKMLGVTLETQLPVYIPPEGEKEKSLILISVFSNSCASRSGKPPNKMLSWLHWDYILALLRQYGEIGLLGSLKDKEEKRKVPVSDEECYMGLPLEKVARLLKEAKLLVTIDNGMGHLAATQGTPLILFYPECLNPKWIIPPAPDSKMLVAQMNPATVTISDIKITVQAGIKKLWR